MEASRIIMERSHLNDEMDPGNDGNIVDTVKGKAGELVKGSSLIKTDHKHKNKIVF